MIITFLSIFFIERSFFEIMGGERRSSTQSPFTFASRRSVMNRTLPFLCLFLVFLAFKVNAGLMERLNETASSLGELTQGQGSGGGLSADEIANGLREALAVGSEKAVTAASSTGGFLDNPSIRIPLPGKLQMMGDTLRRLGMGSKVDEFELTMNRAAEKASSEAFPIIGKAVEDLTLEDVNRLWKGGDTAATDYFKEKTWQPLYDKFRPIVDETAQQAGVTQAYESLVGQPAVKTLVTGTDLDLDHYVTNGTLDGLFKLIASEEKAIRTNPAARTTDLLKKVFGQ
jgi:hypothetical protein